jgi:hypothetical protein
VSRHAWIALVVAFGCKYPDPGGGPSITTDLVVLQTSNLTSLYLLENPAFGALEVLSANESYVGHARVFTLLGFVFVATTDGKLLKLIHDGSGELIDTGTTLDFSSKGIDQFEDSWVVIDTKAWYFDSTGARAFFVDLDTMEILETISLAAADVPGREMRWTGAVQRDEDLYISLYYEDSANPLVHETELTVLRIDSSRTLQPILHDSRCIRAQMVGVSPVNNSVLVVGDSSYYREFGMPSLAPPNCLARIEESPPDVIDPSSGGFWSLDDFMSDDVSGSYAFARTPDLAVFWAREAATFATLAEYQSTSRWRPHQVSVNDLSNQMISDDVVNIGKPGRAFVINDTMYFAVNKRDDNMPGGALRADIGGGDWDEIGTYPAGDIVLVARVD